MNDARSLMRRGTAALLLLLQVVVLAAPTAARQIADPDPTEDGGGGGGGVFGYSVPPEGFRWSAPSRADDWKDAWRERGSAKVWPTETYDGEYVNPSSWPIHVMGCQSENDWLSNVHPEIYEKLQQQDKLEGTNFYPNQTTLYRWQWNGEDTGFTKDCWGKLDFPAQGSYFATLTVRYKNGVEEKWTRPVEVKDLLVVVLGDSSASGEGAPDSALVKNDSGYTTKRADWVDNRCHRSDNAGGAQAAKRLEAADQSSSVTFLSFACSGATLDTDIYKNLVLDPYNPPDVADHRGVGITGPYAGIEPVKNSSGDDDLTQKLPSQVDQLWNALTDFGAHPPRKIDVLIVAGGINDARFADMAGVCVIAPFCYGVRTGVLGHNEMSLDDRFLTQNVKSVPGGWDALGEALADPRPLNNGTWATMSFAKKLALQYPPFFHDDEGDQCSYILYESLPAWAYALAILTFTPFFPPGWTVDEIDHANEFWAPALDENVELGAERNGFDYVDTIANRFHLHGICADDRYINNPIDSDQRQGDADGEIGINSALSSKGTAHPNTKGYSAYADEIMRHINSLVRKEDNVPPVAVWDKVSVSYSKPRTFNVLTNDTDEDPGDVLAARIVSEPQHGTVTMKLDGTATYKPDGRFVGPDLFTYEVTDGGNTQVGAVYITVMKPTRFIPRVIAGETAEIGGLVTGLILEPPYRLEFDKQPSLEQGNFYFEPDDGILYFDPPPIRRRRIRLDYTLYSDTPSVTSPSYGESTRGTLILKPRRAR